jgi:hypothetical protein
VDHHTEDWTFNLMVPGDKLLNAHFDLKRSQESVRAPAGKLGRAIARA